MTIPYHSHEFEIPTADKQDIAERTAFDKVVVPAVLGSAAAVDKNVFATAEQGVLADNAVPSARRVQAGEGLAGGGALTEDIALSLSADKQQAIANAAQRADTAAQAAAKAEQTANTVHSLAEQAANKADEAADKAERASAKAAAAGDVFRRDLGAMAFKNTVALADINASGARNSGTILYGDGIWRAAPQGGTGGSGTGGGDMSQNIYDPRRRRADAFDMDNMLEGKDNKILSAGDKSKLQSLPADIAVKSYVQALIGATGSTADGNKKNPDGSQAMRQRSAAEYTDLQAEKTQSDFAAFRSDLEYVKHQTEFIVSEASEAQEQSELNGLWIKEIKPKLALWETKAETAGENADKAAKSAKLADDKAEKALTAANAAGDVRKSQLGGLAFKNAVQLADITASGVRDSQKFLRGDGKWETPAAPSAAGLPVGMVAPFAGNAAPQGWLMCNGQEVSRTAYAALFAAVGTLYGTGNGSSTFNLPDLRGEFVRGADAGRGADKGRAFGSAQSDAVQNITGMVSCSTGDNKPDQNIFGNCSGAFAQQQDKHSRYYPMATGDKFTSGVYAIDFDVSRVARTAEETRPRNIALLYCIKS